jgi:hypothetical protein
VQVFMQDRVIFPALSGAASARPPLALRLMKWFPALRRIPARVMGMGFQPEHIRH